MEVFKGVEEGEEEEAKVKGEGEEEGKEKGEGLPNGNVEGVWLCGGLGGWEVLNDGVERVVGGLVKDGKGNGEGFEMFEGFVGRGWPNIV